MIVNYHRRVARAMIIEIPLPWRNYDEVPILPRLGDDDSISGRIVSEFCPSPTTTGPEYSASASRPRPGGHPSPTNVPTRCLL